MQVVSQLKAHYRTVDFICCVDSLANARTLSAFFSARQQTLDVLIELGVPGGRCGCRSVDARWRWPRGRHAAGPDASRAGTV
jgi:D-serine deaminase-like pyridoxal phosphate-dependent protein